MTISLSAQTSPLASPTVPTNTLTITNLEPRHFEDTNHESLARLRTLAESFGQVCFFSPLRSFLRVFVVYSSVEDAQCAKSLLHNTKFYDGTILRVYFGQHTDLSMDPEKIYLHLPEEIPGSPEKSGLVSPPGSPPLGHVDECDMMPVDEFVLNEQVDDITVDISMSTLARSNPHNTITSTTTTTTLSTSNTPSIAPTTPGNLRINTLLTTLPSGCGRDHRQCSPTSPSSSTLKPTTPTLLAFSPAKDLRDEQPFITIQDWGMDSVGCH